MRLGDMKPGDRFADDEGDLATVVGPDGDKIRVRWDSPDFGVGQHSWMPPNLEVCVVQADDTNEPNKPSITTLPPEPLRLLVEQFTYGATKSDPTSGKSYGQRGWRQTEGAREKYLDAAFRHFLALLSGEHLDADGRRHDIALAANALILADLADHEKIPF